MKKRKNFAGMVQRYNVKAGLIFSVSISMIATILPKLIRFDVEQLRSVLFNFFYLSACFFFCWMTHHFFLLNIRSGPFSGKVARAAASIFCSVLLIAAATHSVNMNTVLPFSKDPGIELRPGRIFFIRMFRGFIISAIVWFAVYYFRIQVMLQQSWRENESLKQENLQAQLASLKQQISPHFLFNSLNTLSTLSTEEKVKEYILKMSEVYRYVLHYQEQNEVPVHEELAFIRSYTYILQSRFEEGLEISIQVAPGNLNRKVLPFSLQLLVENAIKHNAVSYKNPLAINIYDLGDVLIVENDIRPRLTLDSHSGTGLHNLDRRYRLVSDKKILITRDSSTFKVVIPFLT